jgi:hypothetical protein
LCSLSNLYQFFDPKACQLLIDILLTTQIPKHLE